MLSKTDPTSGTIRIDGIDITTIGLHDLRSRVVSFSVSLGLYPVLTYEQTFVAQDAVLFSGTIRYGVFSEFL